MKFVISRLQHMLILALCQRGKFLLITMSIYHSDFLWADSSFTVHIFFLRISTESEHYNFVDVQFFTSYIWYQVHSKKIEANLSSLKLRAEKAMVKYTSVLQNVILAPTPLYYEPKWPSVILYKYVEIL
ncbi:hypothetical protein O6H91_19G000100 [Diphasiastrum complanatum]|uniref:Uncharacterized protein n=1 Tax=Diphasiastrum complanatum TaxID=34168 RepID=A0ACC2ARY5_DIPCM|nr:hypothetical protein O6H91_Y115800 [Diphasiastrum complanatum]KAJ7520302.1 hypothetical protein O6H91_19G000100 [Diphasiastrum complanatum]